MPPEITEEKQKDITVIQQQKENRFPFVIVFYFFPWLSAMVIIFALSSQPGEDLPHFKIPLVDKLAHLVEYFILSLLSLRLLNLLTNASIAVASPKRFFIYLTILVFIAFYGLADEVHQLYIAERHFELVDLTVDIVASLLLIGLCEVLPRAVKKLF